MLPGIDKQNVNAIHNCLYIKNFENDLAFNRLKDFSFYLSQNCMAECRAYITFLAIKNNIVDVHAYFMHSNVLIRREAARNLCENQIYSKNIDNSTENHMFIYNNVERGKKNTYISKKDDKDNKKITMNKDLKDSLESNQTSCSNKILSLQNNNPEKSKILDFLTDPSQEIRLLAVKNCPSTPRLISLLADQSSNIRYVVLQRFSDTKFINSLSKKDYDIVFDKISDMINDVSPYIRMEAIKALQNFHKVPLQKIKSLLSKYNDNGNITPGLFVHGFEDENSVVRSRCAESICTLTKYYNIANEAFDFLIDVLNDEILEVKEKGSFCMLEITLSSQIFSSTEIIDHLFCNLREKSDVIRKNIFFIIGYLFYVDEDLSYCIDRLEKELTRGVNLDFIYKALEILVSKNDKWFYNKYFITVGDKLDENLQDSDTLLRNIDKIDLFPSNDIYNSKTVFMTAILYELINLGYKNLYNPKYKKLLLYYELKKESALNQIICPFDSGQIDKKPNIKNKRATSMANKKSTKSLQKDNDSNHFRKEIHHSNFIFNDPNSEVHTKESINSYLNSSKFLTTKRKSKSTLIDSDNTKKIKYENMLIKSKEPVHQKPESSSDLFPDGIRTIIVDNMSKDANKSISATEKGSFIIESNYKNRTKNPKKDIDSISDHSKNILKKQIETCQNNNKDTNFSISDQQILKEVLIRYIDQLSKEKENSIKIVKRYKKTIHNVLSQKQGLKTLFCLITKCIVTQKNRYFKKLLYALHINQKGISATDFKKNIKNLCQISNPSTSTNTTQRMYCIDDEQSISKDTRNLTFKIDKIKKLNISNFNMNKQLNLIKILLNNTDLDQISYFHLVCPKTITRKLLLPLQLSILCTVKCGDSENIYLKIKSRNNKEIYSVEEKMKIYFYDIECDSLEIMLFVDTNFGHIRLTKKYFVRIEK